MYGMYVLCSNTSRRTSSDIQTPRGVEIWKVFKSEEVLLTCIWTYFLNYPVFLEKNLVKFGLIYVISSTDFQTSSTLLIVFVLCSWIIEFDNVL